MGKGVQQDSKYFGLAKVWGGWSEVWLCDVTVVWLVCFFHWLQVMWGWANSHPALSLCTHSQASQLPPSFSEASTQFGFLAVSLLEMKMLKPYLISLYDWNCYSAHNNVRSTNNFLIIEACVCWMLHVDGQNVWEKVSSKVQLIRIHW